MTMKNQSLKMAMKCMLLLLTLLSMEHTESVANKKIEFFKNIGGMALDLFGLGTDVFGLIGNGDVVTMHFQEVKDKLDLVLNSVNDLHDKIVYLFEREAQTDTMNAIKSFGQLTGSRFRDLTLIAQTNGTERENAVKKFLDNTLVTQYEDKLSHFCEDLYITSTGQTALQRLADSQRCNMSNAIHFFEYIRDLLYTGITIQAAYNSMRYSFKPELASQFWDKQLGLFEKAVDETITKCIEKFQEYYREDIRSTQVNKSVDEMCKMLSDRYVIDKTFLVIEKQTTTEIYSTGTGEKLQFTCLSHECGKMRCFAYAELNATCENIPAVNLPNADKSMAFCKSNTWAARVTTFTVGDELHWYMLPDVCSEEYASNNASQAFIKPTDDQILNADTPVTCSAIIPSAWLSSLELTLWYGFVVCLKKVV